MAGDRCIRYYSPHNMIGIDIPYLCIKLRKRYDKKHLPLYLRVDLPGRYL